jgi:hypothetical protein
MTFWFEMSRTSGQGKRYTKALAEAKGVRWKTFLPYMFRSFGHFSNSGHTLEATTVAGRLHNVVWAFLVLIILAAYLANLASFLVIQSKKAPSFQDINAILASKAVVCADPADDVANLYLEKYPNLKRYPDQHEVNSSNWVPSGLSIPHALVRAMSSGMCVGAILRTATVDLLQTSSNFCGLTKRDPVTAPFGAGFGFPIDRCGPFMLAVVDSLLLEMQNDGTLNQLWIAEVPPSRCPPASTFFAVASAEALSVDSFAGLFFIYLAFVFGAILLRIFRKLCIRAERKVVERLSRKEQEIAMAETAETVLAVQKNQGGSNVVALDQKVSRIDSAMAEILSLIRHLHPADTASAVESPAAPRAAAATLS